LYDTFVLSPGPTLYLRYTLKYIADIFHTPMARYSLFCWKCC